MSHNPLMVTLGDGGFHIPVLQRGGSEYDILGTATGSYEMLAPGSLHFATLQNAEGMHGNMLRRWPVPSLEPAYLDALNQVGYKMEEGKPIPGNKRGLIIMGVPGLGKTQAAFFLSQVFGYSVTVADCTNQAMSDLLVEVSIDGHTTRSAISRLMDWLESPDAVSPKGKVVTASLAQLCKKHEIKVEFEKDALGNDRLKLLLREMPEKEYTTENDPLAALNRFAMENRLLEQQISAGVSRKNGPLLEVLMRANARGEKIRRVLDNPTGQSPAKIAAALKDIYNEYGEGDVIVIDEYTRRLREGIPHELYSVMAGTTPSFALKDAQGMQHIIEAKNLAFGNFFSIFACNTPTRQERHEILAPSAAVLSRFTLHEVDAVSAVDIAHAGERELTGMILSNHYRMYGADNLQSAASQKEFYASLLRGRAAGLTTSEQLEFNRHQQTLLLHWSDTVEACKRLGELYEFWRDTVHDDALFSTTDDRGNPRIVPEIDPRNIIHLFETARRKSLQNIPFNERGAHAQQQGNVITAPEESFGTEVTKALIAEINRCHPDKKLDRDLLKALNTRLTELKIIPGSAGKAKKGDARSGSSDGRLLEDLLNISPHISRSEGLEKYRLVMAASVVARNHRNFPKEDKSGRRITSIPDAAKGKDPFDPDSYDANALRALLPLHAVQEVLRQYQELGATVHDVGDLPANVRPGLSLYAAMFTQGTDTGSVIVRPENLLVIDGYEFDKLVTPEQLEALTNVITQQAELSYRQGIGLLAAMPGGRTILQTMLFSDAMNPGQSEELLPYQKMLLNRSPYGVGVTTLLVDESDKKTDGWVILQDGGKTKTYYNPIHLVSGPSGMVLVGSGPMPEGFVDLMQQQGVHYFDRLAKNATKAVDSALQAIVDSAMERHKQNTSKDGKAEELVDTIKVALNSRHGILEGANRKNKGLGELLCSEGSASKLALYLPVTSTPETLALMREIAEKGSKKTTGKRG